MQPNLIAVKTIEDKALMRIYRKGLTVTIKYEISKHTAIDFMAFWYFKKLPNGVRLS